MTNPIYAIGDIHGELDMLEYAIEKIESDGGSDAQVVMVGDYIDRGPDSKGVIDYLNNGIAAGKNWKCLLGNHDRMFTYFMEDEPKADPRLRFGLSWLHDRLGGKNTLASYGVDVSDGVKEKTIHTEALAAVPKYHLEFLEALDYFYQINELLFVHAGIRPGVRFEQQDKEDLIWIRDEFHEHTTKYPWLIVHGHTPVPMAWHYGNRINIDTGAGYGNALTTAVFEGSDCWLLGDFGRVALLPETN